MTLQSFYILLAFMTVLAVIVFFALYFVEAGYGILFNKRWGRGINNKVAWVLMEAPVFVMMSLFWFYSDRRFETVPLLFFLFFQTHYFHRAFIFPFLLKGKSLMPWGIMCMGITFNLFNGLMQGTWIFSLSPADMYTMDWLSTPQFIVGTCLFFGGMIVNIHSDQIIRSLRKPGDRNHYLPEKGMFRYVTSANYFGEIVEWTGFALLTWSPSGAVFALWTCANLIPRAAAIHKRYQSEFGDKVGNRKRVIPFIY